MAYEFKKLSDVNVIESTNENAHVLAEQGGEIVRIPASSVGGGLPSGGAPHQQLVTDADGVAMWEDKLFYDKRNFVSEEILIPETSLVASDEMMHAFGHRACGGPRVEISGIPDGFMVIWNGKKYLFHRYDWHLIGSGSGAMNIYGNASLISGVELSEDWSFPQFPDTGEPFALIMTVDMTLFVSAADSITGTVVELHAGKLTGVVKSISPKYIPEIVLPSCTEGSTKRFKLTVDDSGTITATEVI